MDHTIWPIPYGPYVKKSGENSVVILKVLRIGKVPAKYGKPI